MLFGNWSHAAGRGDQRLAVDPIPVQSLGNEHVHSIIEFLQKFLGVQLVSLLVGGILPTPSVLPCSGSMFAGQSMPLALDAG